MDCAVEARSEEACDSARDAGLEVHVRVCEDDDVCGGGREGSVAAPTRAESLFVRRQHELGQRVVGVESKRWVTPVIADHEPDGRSGCRTLMLEQLDGRMVVAVRDTDFDRRHSRRLTARDGMITCAGGRRVDIDAGEMQCVGAPDLVGRVLEVGRGRLPCVSLVVPHEDELVAVYAKRRETGMFESGDDVLVDAARDTCPAAQLAQRRCRHQERTAGEKAACPERTSTVAAQ